MSFNDWLEHEIDKCINSKLDEHIDEFIDRLYKLTTIKANLATFEQKEAMGNIFDELMDKVKDVDINEYMKNNPNLGRF